MTRANRFLASENLAKPTVGCKLFHVEHPAGGGNLQNSSLSVPCGTIPTPGRATSLFHVEHWLLVNGFAGMFHVNNRTLSHAGNGDVPRGTPEAHSSLDFNSGQFRRRVKPAKAG